MEAASRSRSAGSPCERPGSWGEPSTWESWLCPSPFQNVPSARPRLERQAGNGKSDQHLPGFSGWISTRNVTVSQQLCSA